MDRLGLGEEDRDGLELRLIGRGLGLLILGAELDDRGLLGAPRLIVDAPEGARCEGDGRGL